MLKAVFILFVLLLLSSCATGVPYERIQKIKYNDYTTVVFEKLGSKYAEMCKLDSMDSKFIVYKCPVSGGPDTFLYISTKTYRVRGIKRDWDKYYADQAAWAKAIGNIGKSVSETIEKNNTPPQNNNQPVIYENPFGHMQNNVQPFTPKPIGGANELFKY